MGANDFEGSDGGPLPPKWSQQRHAAQQALEGTPFVAVPVEQLASMYERFLRLNAIGSRTVEDWLSMAKPEKEVRHAVFAQSDFGAVFAGQWLPPDVRKETYERVKLLKHADQDERIKDLTAALSMLLEDVGYKGSGPYDENHFYCEYCKADHPAYDEIPHHPGCKVTILRRVRDGGTF